MRAGRDPPPTLSVAIPSARAATPSTPWHDDRRQPLRRSARRWYAWLPDDPVMNLIGALAATLLLIGASFSLGQPGGYTWPIVSMTTAALFLTAGMVAWRRRPHNRIGLLMLLTGLSMWLAGLVDAPVPILSTVGVATQTLPLALTLHLLLAFPSGRVHGQLARVLVVIGYLTCTFLQMPLYLFGVGPLAVWNSSTATSLVPAAIWLQLGVGVFSMLGAAALVAGRALRSDPIERRQLGPMVWYRVLFPLIVAGTAVVSRASSDPSVVGWANNLQLVAILGLPLIFLIGLLFGSFGRAGAVDEVVAQIGAVTPTATELTSAVALALGDSEAVVVYARTDTDGFVDEAGRGVAIPPDGRRRLHPVQHGGRTVGGIVYRPDLIADHSVMDVLAGIVAMGIDEQRLAAEQRALVTDLRARESELYRSRRRLLQAEDSERRRISRDLHDGAQQRIVLLGLVARRLSRSATDPATATAAADIADGMTGLLADFRDLVAGIMPPPLLERGLLPALELLAERMPIPTVVMGQALPQRLPPDAESTVYFTVSEALTNVIKHASATSAQVAIRRTVDASGNRLAVTVADDGVGGADLGAGTGLCGLADRIATLGGTVRVESAPGLGTTVCVDLPCA